MVNIEALRQQLMALIFADSQDEISQLLDTPNVNIPDLINQPSQGQDSPFEYAAVLGRFNILPIFLAKGGAVNGLPSDDYTPLMKATQTNQQQTVIYLLRSGADASIVRLGLTVESFINTVDNDFFVLLHNAIFYDSARKAAPAQLNQLLNARNVLNEHMTHASLYQYLITRLVNDTPVENQRARLNQALDESTALGAYFAQEPNTAALIRSRLQSLDTPASPASSSIIINTPAGAAATGASSTAHATSDPTTKPTTY